MDVSPSDRLAASVFEVGLRHRFVSREQVVEWVDRRILETEAPPGWMIELSLSKDRHLEDLEGDLKRLGEGVDPVAKCEAIYALLPDVEGYGFEQAAALAERIYRITYECLDGDWSHPLLGRTDVMADGFTFYHEGYVQSDPEQLSEEVRRFVREHRDEGISRLLFPVSWVPERREVSSAEAGGADRVVWVGVSGWIIQDGNYDDFVLGQERKFALEFYSANGLRATAAGVKAAEHLSASRYRVRAEVVFVGEGAWVIDTGLFLAFEERQPPAGAVVGGWVEGEVYVGIDPFFYMEYLHRVEGMPRLSYRWRVRRILLETTPWVDGEDEWGRKFRKRAEGREGFVPVRATDAWRDDGGFGEYVLECGRVGGPEGV